MDFRYGPWQERHEKSDGKSGNEKLLSIFLQLLTLTNGNVGEALQWMTDLDNQYELTDGDDGIGNFIDWLKREGYISDAGEEGKFEVLGKATKKIREDSLNEIFTSLRKQSLMGNHRMEKSGSSEEPLPESRNWKFGDNLQNIDFTESLNNSLKRAGIDEITFHEEDLKVHDTEHQTSCATVLMIDISHSMILYGEDRITPAKRVAMALAELITSRYPKDSLDIILFGDEAWEVSIQELPFVSVGPYHTNTKAGLNLARALLRRRKNKNKQIFMITDGKPSAINEGIKIYKNSFGLDRKIVNKTLDEAVLCRKDKIVITTFMLATDTYLQNFVNELTEVAKGRAYFSGLDHLGDYMFTDYIRNRKKKLR
ncbi:MAG: VWA domain-containing protein [Chloroherpetonaceae bacterium]|nr:VWA domain-containing protein [Chloroherpetonaceae bacterium]